MNQDSKLLAEAYGLIREQTVDSQVIQFIDRMQIPEFSGAQFAQLLKAKDPCDICKNLQALRSAMQKGITPQKFKEILMSEIQKAMQQNPSIKAGVAGVRGNSIFAALPSTGIFNVLQSALGIIPKAALGILRSGAKVPKGLIGSVLGVSNPFPINSDPTTQQKIGGD